jgi:hypothetical protein
VGCGGLSRAAAVQCAVHMPRLHRAATVVLAVEQHRRSRRSAGLEGEEAGTCTCTCTCSVEAVYIQQPALEGEETGAGGSIPHGKR